MSSSNLTQAQKAFIAEHGKIYRKRDGGRFIAYYVVPQHGIFEAQPLNTALLGLGESIITTLFRYDSAKNQLTNGERLVRGFAPAGYATEKHSLAAIESKLLQQQPAPAAPATSPPAAGAQLLLDVEGDVPIATTIGDILQHIAIRYPTPHDWAALKTGTLKANILAGAANGGSSKLQRNVFIVLKNAVSNNPYKFFYRQLRCDRQRLRQCCRISSCALPLFDWALCKFKQNLCVSGAAGTEKSYKCAVAALTIARISEYLCRFKHMNLVLFLRTEEEEKMLKKLLTRGCYKQIQPVS